MLYYSTIIYWILLLVFIAAALRQPFWGVVYYYYLSFFRPQDYYHWALGFTRFSFYIGLVTIFSYFINKHKNGYYIPKTKEVIFMFLFCIFMGISTYFSPLPERSWQLYVLFFKITIFYFFAVAMINTERRFKIMLWVMIYSFVYYAIWTNIRFIFEGIKIIEGPGLGNATYRDRNNFALLFVITIPVCFYMRYLVKNKLLKLSLLGTVPVLMHAVICTFSRGGYLGMLVSGGYSILRLRKKSLIFLVVLITIPLLLRMQGKEHRLRMKSIFSEEEERDLAARSRIESWKGGLRMMFDHPLLGVGLDNYEIYIREYNPSVVNLVAHNTYIQIGAEGGIPALIFYVLILLSSLVTLFKLRHRCIKEKLSERLYYYTVMLEGSILGFFICSLFLSLEILEPAYFLFCMVVCLKQLVGKKVFHPEIK